MTERRKNWYTVHNWRHHQRQKFGLRRVCIHWVLPKYEGGQIGFFIPGLARAHGVLTDLVRVKSIWEAHHPNWALSSCSSGLPAWMLPKPKLTTPRLDRRWATLYKTERMTPNYHTRSKAVKIIFVLILLIYSTVLLVSWKMWKLPGFK